MAALNAFGFGENQIAKTARPAKPGELTREKVDGGMSPGEPAGAPNREVGATVRCGEKKSEWKKTGNRLTPAEPHARNHGALTPCQA